MRCDSILRGPSLKSFIIAQFQARPDKFVEPFFFPPKDFYRSLNVCKKDLDHSRRQVETLPWNIICFWNLFERLCNAHFFAVSKRKQTSWYWFAKSAEAKLHLQNSKAPVIKVCGSIVSMMMFKRVLLSFRSLLPLVLLILILKSSLWKWRGTTDREQD